VGPADSDNKWKGVGWAAGLSDAVVIMSPRGHPGGMRPSRRTTTNRIDQIPWRRGRVPGGLGIGAASPGTEPYPNPDQTVKANFRIENQYY
jgi:hypothetical protein